MREGAPVILRWGEICTTLLKLDFWGIKRSFRWCNKLNFNANLPSHTNPEGGGNASKSCLQPAVSYNRRRHVNRNGGEQCTVKDSWLVHDHVSESVRRPVEAAAPLADVRTLRGPQGGGRVPQAAAFEPGNVPVSLYRETVWRRGHLLTDWRAAPVCVSLGSVKFVCVCVPACLSVSLSVSVCVVDKSIRNSLTTL